VSTFDKVCQSVFLKVRKLIVKSTDYMKYSDSYITYLLYKNSIIIIIQHILSPHGILKTSLFIVDRIKYDLNFKY